MEIPLSLRSQALPFTPQGKTVNQNRIRDKGKRRENQDVRIDYPLTFGLYPRPPNGGELMGTKDSQRRPERIGIIASANAAQEQGISINLEDH